MWVSQFQFMQDVLLKEAYWTRRIYWNVQVNYRVVSQSNVNQFFGFHTIGVIDGSDVKNGIIVVVTDPLFCPNLITAQKFSSILACGSSGEYEQFWLFRTSSTVFRAGFLSLFLHSLPKCPLYLQMLQINSFARHTFRWPLVNAFRHFIQV